MRASATAANSTSTHPRGRAFISRLKALHAAWEAFCAGLGISASDTDKMLGLPFLGAGRALDLIEEIVGEIAPDEDYRRRCLDHMTEFWDTTIRDRWLE